jgi:hypothetical protein
MHSATPLPTIADLLKLALAGQGLADSLTTLYYAGTVSPLLGMPLQLLANAVTFIVPAADLVWGNRLRVRGGTLFVEASRCGG